MAWDEWEQLKAEAAKAAEARMSLASAAPDGAGGGGKLKHSGGPWTSASGAAGMLQTSTQTSRSRLRPAHEGIASGAAGLASVAMLNAVLDSWEKRLAAVRGECDYLENALLKVAKEMGETETAVKSSLSAVKTAIAGERP
ncbi:hypothetical protein J7E91_01130 [Streptomyces sp. ISL-99]|uniref:hypothetical protein n=1 Tax=Streptomyces sp. ISL-99 TaxID=2819193 RepID=UPI001BE5AFCE|nr:hypothetical protein [Streptomyces sp. ISL-99]MBT2524066.1 hypothetical protein [Streptomyces sp. ISL-99]